MEGWTALECRADFGCSNKHSPREPCRFFYPPPRFESVANEEVLLLKVTNENNLVQHLPFINEEAEGLRGELVNNYNLLHILGFNTQCHFNNKQDFVLVPCHHYEVKRSTSTLQMRRLRS